MKLRKIIKIFFLCLIFLAFFPRSALAQTEAFINLVNPVRGEEFLEKKSADPLSAMKRQKEIVDRFNLPATWLLRRDAFTAPENVGFFKNFSSTQELGLFLEITPGLAQEAGVNYPAGGVFWHDANKIFLSGYKPENRIRLVDSLFNDFKESFGYFPRSVGAWHVDAYSARYMREKYGVTGVLICADQFGTDSYQIWGGWWGVPFYPSKYNILTPAQEKGNKLDLVVSWWAARDPALGYGGSVQESAYSVQANDYIGHSLGINYFQKLLDTYLKDDRNRFGQVTIGLENDNDWGRIGNNFFLQLEEVKRRREAGVRVLTMKEFSDWYRSSFPGISPRHYIGDWIMDPAFRVGLIDKDGQKVIRDLRIYNDSWPEANLLTANPWGSLSLNNPYKIDTVRFSQETKKPPLNFSLKSLIEEYDSQKIPFKASEVWLAIFYFFLAAVLLYFSRRNLPLFFLILVGSVSLSLTMVKSGLVYPYGMGFWGPNGHDGIWHLALISQLERLSLAQPVFSGSILTNYHFGFDLIAAILRRLTGIPAVNLYFQILPPIMAILLGVLSYRFVFNWTSSKASAWWATFFVYFGGSWGWLLSLVRTGQLGGESSFWANQAISTLINPPFVLSLIFLLLGLQNLLNYQKGNFRKNLFLASLFFGLLLQIKVYGGILVLGGLGAVWLFSLFKRDRSGDYFKLLGLTAVISLLVFLPFNYHSSSLLVFSPLWFPRTMLAFGDRFYWPRLENARLTYWASGQWLKGFLAEGLALAIFLLGNLGTRVIGFWRLRHLKRAGKTEVFLFSFLFFSLVLPLLFIQKGNPWNTIQFFYYSQFLMAILAGVVIGSCQDRVRAGRRVLVFLALAVLTLPTTIGTLVYNYLPQRPPARISLEELEALDFLRQEPQGNVLAYPYNPDWRAKFSEPRPLYAYETTAYIAAFSGKALYLEDEMNLEISGYDWSSRKEASARFFLTNDRDWARKLLEENRIKYLYLVKGQKMNLGLADLSAGMIFENGEVAVYKILIDGEN